MSDRYRFARCLTAAAIVARILLSAAAFCRAFFRTSFGGQSFYFVLSLFLLTLVSDSTITTLWKLSRPGGVVSLI